LTKYSRVNLSISSFLLKHYNLELPKDDTFGRKITWGGVPTQA